MLTIVLNKYTWYVQKCVFQNLFQILMFFIFFETLPVQSNVYLFKCSRDHVGFLQQKNAAIAEMVPLLCVITLNVVKTIQ